MSQFAERNLSMMMDFYEMTMSHGYFSNGIADRPAAFDVFFRKNPDQGGFAVFAGLEQVLEFISTLHFDKADIDYFRSLKLFDEKFLACLQYFHFRGDIHAFAEGTVMYPNEPMITVTAPLMDAQLVETALLSQINHQSLVATKAQRIVRAARGRGIADFGARRAHNMDAAVYGARAAYIGGVSSTATVLAGQMFNIPISGTMAHSWIMCYGDEFAAFSDYARAYPDATFLLVDTYNVLRSGIPNAIRVAREILEPMGKRLKGVRIDSGDLAYLSKKSREMLDEAGLHDCVISVSNSLDEYTITSILDQGGCINSFGVGERLITASSDPVLGAVYKLVAVQEDGFWQPRIKISEMADKITNPGRKRVYRIFGDDGHAIADLLTLGDEEVDMSAPYRFIDPESPWKEQRFRNFSARELQLPVVVGGKRVAPPAPLEAIRAYVKHQVENEIWPEEQRFENPHRHQLVMSPAYYEMRMRLLTEDWKNFYKPRR